MTDAKGLRENETEIHEGRDDGEGRQAEGREDLELKTSGEPGDKEEGQGVRVGIPGMIMVPLTHYDLSSWTYEYGQTLYRERFGIYASTIIVPPESLREAYRIMTAEREPIIVVAVPGMPVDSWMLTGPRGIFYSQGA